MPDQSPPTQPSRSPEFLFVDAQELRFDPDNPRFGGLLSDRSQEGIQQYLMGRPHYASELVDSLLENGFIPYEPLVVKRATAGYVVLEGNRRLAAVKHILANPDKYSQSKIDALKRLPVLLFPASSGSGHNPGETIYLGVRHLFGFREWPPLSKAKFLDKEISSEPTLNRAVRELGISKQEVKRYLIPYRVLLKANLSIPVGQDFWVLGEALSRSGISKYINLEVDRKTLVVANVNRKKLGFLMDFLYGAVEKGKKERNPETARIRDTRQLRDLSKALQSEAAAGALEKGWELQLSLVFVETKEENVKRLKSIVNELSRLLKDGLKLKSTRKDDKPLLDAFRELQAAATNYIKNAKSDI